LVGKEVVAFTFTDNIMEMGASALILKVAKTIEEGNTAAIAAILMRMYDSIIDSVDEYVYNAFTIGK